MRKCIAVLYNCAVPKGNSKNCGLGLDDLLPGGGGWDPSKTLAKPITGPLSHNPLLPLSRGHLTSLCCLSIVAEIEQSHLCGTDH